jgi:hypothetical protein
MIDGVVCTSIQRVVPTWKFSPLANPLPLISRLIRADERNCMLRSSEICVSCQFMEARFTPMKVAGLCGATDPMVMNWKVFGWKWK